jgi:hypothetical protein
VAVFLFAPIMLQRMSPLLAQSEHSRHRNILSVIGQERTLAGIASINDPQQHARQLSAHARSAVPRARLQTLLSRPMLILKRTSKSRPSGQRSDDDYDVFDGDKPSPLNC